MTGRPSDPGGAAQAPPVLVQLTRGTADAPGRVIESRHRGHLAIVDATGRMHVSLGDPAASIVPRSAIKTLQALPLVASGAADRFGFKAPEIALAQASHDAEPEHLAVARGMLAAIGAGVDDLACGTPARPGPNARSDPGPLTPLHHECSGKHAGMLTVARMIGAPLRGYERIDHPVQLAVRAAIEEMTGVRLDAGTCGTDGCSLPTWPAPLGAFAHAMARLNTREAGQRLIDAVAKAPQMIWGTGQFDTLVARALGPAALTKRGAEGVFCGVVDTERFMPHPRDEHRLGFAVKIEDGGNRAARVVAATVLRALMKSSHPDAPQAFEGGVRPIRTARGVVVGEMRPSSLLTEALGAFAGTEEASLGFAAKSPRSLRDAFPAD